MRIAYLLLVHSNPGVLAKLIETLSTDDSGFFIHIDRKVDIKEFSMIAGQHVSISVRRLPVYWGGFSIVEATLALMQQALQHSKAFDYLVLLSASDYPLRGSEYIHTFFRASRGAEFINIVQMPDDDAGMPLSKINRLWFEPDKPVRRFATRALAKFGLAERDHKEYLGPLTPYAGSMWWALTGDACEYILQFVKANPHIPAYYARTPAPDEMFFQTVLGNSNFAARMKRNLHYIDWPDRGNHPALINERHIARFEASEKVWLDDRWGSGEALFARKFSDARLDLVEQVNQMIRRKEKAGAQLVGAQ